MKRWLLTFLLLPILQNVQGQTVSSSCTASDSIIAAYKDDADLLAVQSLYERRLPDTADISIPAALSDTLLRVLIAVYNAVSLPARDTVVELLHIHSPYPEQTLRKVTIIPDGVPAGTWMDRLVHHNLPVGNDTIDSLMTRYDLNHYDVIPSALQNYPPFITFTSDSNLNMHAMLAAFGRVTGVFGGWTGASDPPAGDPPNHIQATIYNDYIRLIYSHGWGDCLSGCMNRRYWEFKVEDSCSVSFLGCYGDPLPKKEGIGNGQAAVEEPIISVYPNPFTRELRVNGLSAPFTYTLYNILGRKVLSGMTTDGRIEGLEGLTENMYILSLRSAGHVATLKVLKKN